MGDTDALLSRILETEAADQRSATAIHRNDDGIKPGSGDEVGFVNHASGLAAANADEHAFVQPVELG